MNRRQLAMAFLLAACSLGAGSFAHAQSVSANIHIGPSGRSTVDIGFFSNDLAPYGRWVERPVYGRVFVPRVRHGWRPYHTGHWVYTDYGWTWVSDEPFGWATYHYGRWAYDPEFGWYWVPGTEWGPAWVSWQEGGDYLGWAPLPPDVGFDARVGLGRVSVSIAPDWYTFVPEQRFLEPQVTRYAVPVERNVTIFRDTRNVTRYQVVNQRIVNQSIPVTRIQQVTGHPVQRFQVTDIRGNDRQRFRVQGNQVAFFRPEVVRGKGPQGKETRAANAPQREVAAPAPRADARHEVPVQPAEGRGPMERRARANRPQPPPGQQAHAPARGRQEHAPQQDRPPQQAHAQQDRPPRQAHGQPQDRAPKQARPPQPPQAKAGGPPHGKPPADQKQHGNNRDKDKEGQRPPG
jgi:uncharacterized protein DUF6600